MVPFTCGLIRISTLPQRCDDGQTMNRGKYEKRAAHAQPHPYDAMLHACIMHMQWLPSRGTRVLSTATGCLARQTMMLLCNERVSGERRAAAVASSHQLNLLLHQVKI
jgi:hypothetical protein